MISHQSFLLIAGLVLPILAYRGQLDFGLPHPGYRHSRPHLHDLGRLPLSDLGRHPDLGRLPHPDLLRPSHAEFSPRSVDSLLYQLERRDQIRYWQFLDLVPNYLSTNWCTHSTHMIESRHQYTILFHLKEISSRVFRTKLIRGEICVAKFNGASAGLSIEIEIFIRSFHIYISKVKEKTNDTTNIFIQLRLMPFQLTVSLVIK